MTGGWLADFNWHFPFLIYLFALVLLPLIIFGLFEPNRDLGLNHRESRPKIATPSLLILIYAIALLTQIIFYLIPVQLPFYLQSLTEATASQSGLAIALSTFFSFLASINYGRVKEDVAASMQNQAFHAVLFLFREVFKQDLDLTVDAVRAKKSKYLAIVLTKDR